MTGRAGRRLLALLGLSCGLALLLPASALAADVQAPPDAEAAADVADEQAMASALATDAPAPSSLAVDAEGGLYVTDYAGDRVLKYAPDGTLLAQWGSRGRGPGQFSGPFGVAVERETGTVYVVDQLNNRVQAFASDGTYLASWGEAGSAMGQLRTPFGVVVAPEGLYVADFGNDRVQLFSRDGQVVWQWGGRGTAEGRFTRPVGVALDAEGNVYVSDHFNDRVQKFGSDGQFKAQIGARSSGGASLRPLGDAEGLDLPLPDSQLVRPEGVALDGQGNLYVADYGRHRVAKFAPDGRLLAAWGSQGSGPTELLRPKGVAVDAISGRVYVADTGNGRIQRLAPDGTFETPWLLPPLEHAPPALGPLPLPPLSPAPEPGAIPAS